MKYGGEGKIMDEEGCCVTHLKNKFLLLDKVFTITKSYGHFIQRVGLVGGIIIVYYRVFW